jgi:four helix bundle protein
MEYVQRYKELEVYKLARQLSKDIFNATKKFPKEETYSLTDQVRRSSRSVGAQIAEVWGKRRYEKHFISKLTDGDGEQLETQHWIETALDCAYLSKDEATFLQDKCLLIGEMISSMIKKSHLFCGKETPPDNT